MEISVYKNSTLDCHSAMTFQNMTRAYKMHQKRDISVFDPACDGVPIAKQN